MFGDCVSRRSTSDSEVFSYTLKRLQNDTPTTHLERLYHIETVYKKRQKITNVTTYYDPPYV